MQQFMTGSDVVDRVLGHVKNNTTDRGDETWREPVDNYRSTERLEQELAVFKSVPTPICPAVAIDEPGAYLARVAAGTPLIVVRGKDGKARAFKNACRHRGTQLTAGSGCAGAFVCPYHGWSYGLDGKLLGIPHSDGFPDVQKSELGLAEVTVIERHGLIYIVQDGDADSGHMLDGLPDFLQPDQQLFGQNEAIIEANWKLHLESFLEGYHIKPAHTQTFYPFGYDNLNVIEFCGPHARVTFPFRRIEQLADVEPAKRDVTGKLTYVYHLFPNVLVAKLSHHINLVILEPIDVTRTRATTYHLTDPMGDQDEETVIAAAKKDLDFVSQTGQQEDVALVEAIQRSLNSGANDEFIFGEFEPAIVHFHKEMGRMLAEM